jgi:hypothetical protein
MKNSAYSVEEINQFLALAFITFNRIEEARKLLDEHPYLANRWRDLALQYSDKDDLDNALYSFQKSYENGDRKSIPWLLELLKQYRPEESQISKLEVEQAAHVQNNDLDVLFSLGNMQLMADNFAETYRLWQPFLGKGLWIFERNLYGNLLKNVEATMSIAEKEFGHLSSRSEMVASVVNLCMKYWKEEADAVTVLIGLIIYDSSIEEVEEHSNFTIQELFTVSLSHAKSGNPWPLFFTLIFANGFQLEAPVLRNFVESSGLNQVLVEAGLDSMVNEKPTAPSNANFQGTLKVGNRSRELEEIFNRAASAQKVGDSFAEIKAWVDGAKLGDPDCFYNIGVIVGKELGIVCNFFGCTGGGDEIWGELAKGIQMDDLRPMENKINYLNEPLLKPVIANYRERYGFSGDNSPNSLELGNPSCMTKIEDFLEFVGFQYVKLSNTTLALPYIEENQTLITFIELVNDGERDVFLIHTPIMTSRINEEGEFTSSKSVITTLEEKLLRIIIRSQQLIFPNMGIWLGDIFTQIPEANRPNIFINSMQANEIWTFMGFSKEIVVEPIPTRNEFTQLNLGYAVDVSLESDQFDTAIRGAFGAIIGVATTIGKMQKESSDLFALMFDLDAVDISKLNVVGLPRSEQLTLGVKVALLDKALEEFRDRNDTSSITTLENNGLNLASRLVTMVDLNRKNIDFIAQTLLRISANYDDDLEIRNALNNVAWKFDAENREDSEVMALFEASVRLGCSNAMSNISWRLMLQERFEESVKLYDKYYYKLMTTRIIPEDFIQAANFRSNIALSRWALGATREELINIWSDEYHQGRHAESLFYPILYDYINGDRENMKQRMDALEQHVISELVETFEEGKKNRGWFGGISKVALELLQKERPKRGIFR